MYSSVNVPASPGMARLRPRGSPRRLAPVVFAAAVLAPLVALAQSATPPGAVAGSSGTAAPQGGQPSAPAGWSDGFLVQSANGDYRLQFGLLLQADGRFALDDEDGNVVNTFAIRRLRPFIRGRLAQRFEFYVNPDFAGGTLVVQDAYVDTRFSPAFIVRLGKGKAPFGLERLQPVSYMLFFERALPTALVPNRDVGIQVLGDLHGGVISYAAGVMNGVPDGASADGDTNDGKDLAGRVAVRPFGPPSARPLSGLTLAIAGTTGNQTGALPTLRTSILQTFATYTGANADGRLNRYSPAVSYYFRRVAAIGEYVHTQVPIRRASVRGNISHEAWQIAGSYVVTDDTATDRGVRPKHNFDFGQGHLGALQVAARYHVLTVDEQAFALGLIAQGSSQQARAWTFGLNWYVNPVLKYVVDFERTVFDQDAVGARHAENALAFRAQVSF